MGKFTVNVLNATESFTIKWLILLKWISSQLKTIMDDSFKIVKILHSSFKHQNLLLFKTKEKHTYQDAVVSSPLK